MLASFAVDGIQLLTLAFALNDQLIKNFYMSLGIYFQQLCWAYYSCQLIVDTSMGEDKPRRERIIFQHLSMYKYHVTIGRSSKSGSWLERIRHSLSQIWWQNSGFPLFEKVLSWIFYLPFKLCYWFNYSTLFVISKRKCLKGAPDILRLLPFNLPL